jgi:hypothetical protein
MRGHQQSLDRPIQAGVFGEHRHTLTRFRGDDVDQLRAGVCGLGIASPSSAAPPVG